MELKKANDTYDVYNAKISYLEMKAIADALAAGGEGPVADELQRSFEWHLERVPGPGEDKESMEKAKEQGADLDLPDVPGADKPEVPADKPKLPLPPVEDLDADVKAEADRMLPPPDDDV